MKNPKLFAIVNLVLLAAAFTGVVVWERSQGQALKARAERVFEFDRRHQNELPSGLLRKLSVAVEFRDDQGAEALLSKLEGRIELN